MSNMSKNYNHRVEQKFVIEHFIDQMHAALKNGSAQLFFQHDRDLDQAKDDEHLNQNAVSSLFPDEDVTEALKRELNQLAIADYVETVKDKRLPNKSETRVFIKKIADQYLHMNVRMELDRSQEDGRHDIFVMSVHRAEEEAPVADFPFKKTEVS